jgi:hypothetical protein
LLVLIGLTLAFWLLVGLPARWLGGGDLALLYSGTAALLCLVPGVITLLWVGRTSAGPEQQLTAVLAGTSVRMFLVLGVTFLLLVTLDPYRGAVPFAIWVLVFYLFTLALETRLVLSARSSRQEP